MIITSSFKNGKNIPSKYACEGDDVNPPFLIKDIPRRAKSMVLIIDDPDAPKGVFTHWVVFNISISKNVIEEDSVPGVEGKNDAGRNGYIGPCPPNGTHRYFFRLYALKAELNLDKGAARQEVEAKMNGLVVENAELMGKYSKK
jgi:hypothetical protein